MAKAQRTYSKVFQEGDDNYKIRVTAEIQYIESNKKPFFSLTFDTWKESKTAGIFCKWVASGCGRDTILAYFPELSDFADFHLRDIDGAPMYPVANGFYYVKNNMVDELANHLLVSREEAEQIANECGTKEQFAERIAPMFARWKKQAEELIVKYRLAMPPNWIPEAE